MSTQYAVDTTILVSIFKSLKPYKCLTFIRQPFEIGKSAVIGK